MTKSKALTKRSKLSLTVREACPVDCQAHLTSILSDGEQAKVTAKEMGDKVTCVDEKVQVIIDGARGLSIQWLKPSNVCTFRRQTGKSSGTRNKLGYSTSGQ